MRDDTIEVIACVMVLAAGVLSTLLARRYDLRLH